MSADPIQFLDDTIYRQGNLFTRAGNPQNFSGRRSPFIATEEIFANTPFIAEEVADVIPVAEGQLPIVFPPKVIPSPPANYFQGNLMTRAGNPQNFLGNRAPFIAADPVQVVIPTAPDVSTPVFVTPEGQLSLPIDQAEEIISNRYRPGAVIRATGADLERFPELRRFQSTASEFVPPPTLVRGPNMGTMGGAALTLLSPEFANRVAVDDYMGALIEAGKNVGAGMVGEAGVRMAGRGLRRVAPTVVSRVAPAVAAVASRVAIPAVTGASLFAQGRTGSPLHTIVNKAAGSVPGLRANPKTDIGRRTGNELMYILNSLGRGSLPYAR